MEDARKAAAWYGYGAHVLLDPIEVPGTAYVVDLAKRTRMLLEWTEAERAGAAGTVSATVAADTAEAMGAVGVTAAAEATGTACAAGAADTTGAADAAGRSGLTAWCKRVEDLVARGVEGADALAEEQRAVAADRTRLCRGISQDAPLPPPTRRTIAKAPSRAMCLPATGVSALDSTARPSVTTTWESNWPFSTAWPAPRRPRTHGATAPQPPHTRNRGNPSSRSTSPGSPPSAPPRFPTRARRTAGPRSKRSPPALRAATNR